MQIRTNLNKQDYIQAYRELCLFILKRPLFAALLVVTSFIITAVPFAALPLKMAIFGFATTVIVCITTTIYRTGTLRGALQELLFQQKLFLPAIAAIVGLSWLGLVVADVALLLFSNYPSVGAEVIAPSNQQPLAGTAMLAVVIAATIVCIAQIMPYVLAHFCRGLDISKTQGEHIWLALMMKAKTFLAFLPLAQLVPLGLIFKIDTTGVLLLAAALYSTFLLFIVFNIEPKEPEKAVTLNLASQL